jgi:cell division septum initiation protein DivIVA
MATATFHPRGKDDNPSREPNQPKDQNKDANQAKEPLDKAKETGTHVVDKAKELGSEVVDKAKEMGSEAMGKAKEAASSVGEMASHAATNIGKKADEYTATAGTSVKNLGEKIEEQGPHGGMLGQASHVVADTLRTSGHYIEEAKLSGMADDVTGMIRRNPVPAVLVGIGIGFLLGRAMRT